jgi:hypothetical protein
MVAMASGGSASVKPGNSSTQPLLGKKAGGCHKCGQQGHWARDCTVTLDQLKQSRVQGVPGGETLDVTGTPQEGGAAPSQPGKRPRPKLTVDLIQESRGIPDIRENFYASMKVAFRGKGHEVSDARRLLELYKRWSDRVMPISGHGETFDAFISGVENFSSRAVIKDALNRMREGVLQEAHRASKRANMPDAHAHDGCGLEKNDDLDPDEIDDELLALAGVDRPKGDQDGRGLDDLPEADVIDGGAENREDDDELLELAGVDL